MRRPIPVQKLARPPVRARLRTRLLAIAAIMAMAAVGVVVAATPASAASVTVTRGDLSYSLDTNDRDAGATVLGCANDPCANKNITIPLHINYGGNDYGVKTIAEQAFLDQGLTKVTIGANVRVIDDGAFIGNKLTTLTIPPSVTDIGNGTFADNLLTSVQFGSGLKNVGWKAFLDNKLTAVTLQNSVVNLGWAAFEENELTSVTLSSAMTQIGARTFLGNKLASITIPGNIKKIEASAFHDNKITDLTLNNGVQTIEHGAFYQNLLTDVSLPASVSTVEKSAFGSNPQLAKVSFNGPAPIVTAAGADGSFDTTGAVKLHYSADFAESWMFPDGFTAPTWKGYNTVKTAIASCPPYEFNDVRASNQFCGDIAWLARTGVTTGYGDGGFHPTTNITRQAMAAFLYRFANPGKPAPTCPATPAFNDIFGNPFCGEIQWMADEGLSTPYPDGGFHPTATIKRHALAAQLYRLANPGQTPAACPAQPALKDIATNPFCGEIQWLVGEGIVEGWPNNTFRPTRDVSRQAMAAFLNRTNSSQTR